MSVNEDKVLCTEQWKIEAHGIINDVKCHVREIVISTKLINENSCIYLNLTTHEGLKFCIEVSSEGFAVVGNDYDLVASRENEKFETPYSLLDSLSPQYRNSFGNELNKKLIELAKKNDSE